VLREVPLAYYRIRASRTGKGPADMLPASSHGIIRHSTLWAQLEGLPGSTEMVRLWREAHGRLIVGFPCQPANRLGRKIYPFVLGAGEEIGCHAIENADKLLIDLAVRAGSLEEAATVFGGRGPPQA
jgi:hypothetical protein